MCTRQNEFRKNRLCKFYVVPGWMDAKREVVIMLELARDLWILSIGLYTPILKSSVLESFVLYSLAGG